MPQFIACRSRNSLFAKVFKAFTPPIVFSILSRIQSNGSLWKRVDCFDYPCRGWNVEAVANTYRNRWPEYVKYLESGDIIGIPPDAIKMVGFDLAFHNSVMSFAHAFSSVLEEREISFFDWGCALGHFGILAKRLFPHHDILYSGKDLPVMVKHARLVQPGVEFFDDNLWMNKRFDFVMANTSFHYAKDWKRLGQELVKVCKGNLLITGLPVIEGDESFAFLQRADAYGYQTEYVGWCFNRECFIEAFQDLGCKLAFEYKVGYAPKIVGAKRQCEYRGFLFNTKYT